MKKIVALVLSLVMVLGLATTAFGVETKLYKQDSGSTSNTTTWDEVAIPAADAAKLPAELLVEADYEFGANLMPTGGWVDHYVFDGVGYFVEATKATGEYKLVCGNVEIYLTKVASADVEYDYQAEVYTNLTTDEDECGKLEVAKKNLTKTYYVVYNEKDIPVLYYVKNANGGVKLLVDGEFVKAELQDTFVEHSWVGNDVDAATKAYTSMICEKCGKVAKLYANADAAGKYSQFVGYGWITAADAGYAPQVVEAPETDKVESAETFDAGIAMYVGMSVMAAAGSAVVLKKKD